jgi:pSer/pThr/pTyr-binding forkhead associated (FHA) protein
LNPKAEAYLAFLPDSVEKLSAAPISITAGELTFGLDTSQASFVLDDPSVDGLHARLVRQEDGSFLLVDQGSVAGTWVNYAEVPSEGQVLQHGDVIHFGRVGFRFTLRSPQYVRKPVITPLEIQK